MLWLLDTGKMAHRFGKWRGHITGLCGLATCFIAALISNLEELVSSFLPIGARTDGPTALTWTWIAVLAVGVFTILVGGWQVYKDEMHGAYIDDADHYQREGW